MKIALLIILTMILAIMLIQIKITFIKNQNTELAIRILFFKIRIIPRNSNDDLHKKKRKKTKESNNVEKTAANKNSKKNKKRIKITVDDVLDAIPYIYNSIKNALRIAGKRVKLDPFTINICFADEDPSITAKNYGRASTLMWTLMPNLEKTINIPNPAIHLDVNYQESNTNLSCDLGLKIRIFDILCIGINAILPLLKLLIHFKKKKKQKI